MAFKVSKILQLPQSTLQYIPQDDIDPEAAKGTPIPTLGGILSDVRYIWQAKGPCLEIRDTRTGIKVGAWTFGCILKDSNTKVVCVDEIQRPNSRLSLLAVGIDCGTSGSMICVFEVLGSKVIRAIQIREKITSLHVVDSGYEVLNLPGPLRNFDGIIAVGTEGGNVYLVDICRQTCEEASYSLTLRDELSPCQLVLLTLKDISKIEYYKERSVRDGDHLALHLNVVLHSLTQHFTLKGPKGDDRIHVNRDEVVASALYYCPQLTSLLVGFNFGAFQLWDLTNLKLIYTSPICEEHLPITRFALQEPADDPRAFCYVWVTYSNTELFQTGLPFAVMYSLCYESKEYHEGYGYLYQDFQICSVRFQMELGVLEEHRGATTKAKGGYCVALNPICKSSVSRDSYAHDSTGDALALCVISWTVWFNYNDSQTYTLLFDLNQWYKEQMPEFTKWTDCSNYILRVSVSELTVMSGRKAGAFLDIKIDKKSLRQFTGVQRLEEHFYPSALSFDVWGLRKKDIVSVHSEGTQRALLAQIEAAGPLCLIRPNDVYRQAITLGMTPLFTDLSVSVTADTQREVILNIGLEHQLVAWLCKCASEWANGSFSSAGCSLDFLVYWAFQRAVVLKTNCDKYCTPLFDYSQSRLDNNTSVLLNSCIRQINSLCTFYSYVINKLSDFMSNPKLVVDQQGSLKMVSTYFEVLQWLVNVGLLPECHPSTYPRASLDKISAPYPIQELTEYYNEKRAQLQLLSKDSFVRSDSLLFIDNLISNKCGAELLQKQWQDDGGSGLYPPPSLQAMLRTYLVEDSDISHKHSLVIYVLLDLAMALDQSRYASVITHLIKFPAVFKVSSSIIKITQAFWQLDHGDYTTAMEQLLDPFVLGDDLEPWHHAIAMRGLLLQNQYNFALLYMQIRKPPVIDEKDVFTAISLFIANGMLDEAFYFKDRHHVSNEENLLMHLFNECNKNDSLHVLLYRSLKSDEEKAFFKYLKSVENPTADDLQVFYYLLRSRFVEAFDTHDSSKRKKPDGQGLAGQRNASKRDQIVRIFKTLLPDVNRNLVDVVRRERTNLWKEVTRPTPLSVFVHNTNEQIQYKSTLIHAALSKAKRTFFHATDDFSFKDIMTEDTPFLRTPKAKITKSRQITPIIAPRMIELNESGEETGPTPSKRLKLTPRASTTSPRWSNISIHSKMLTPIVKRKTSTQNQSVLSNSNVCTPQSILKVRNLVKNNDDTIDDILENYEGLARIDTSPRKSGLGLQPRKSISQTDRRPQVKFDDAARFSSSFSDVSNKPSLNNTSFEDKSTLSSKDISLMVSSKNSSGSNTEDVFYSPNSSVSELSKSHDEGSGEVESSEMEVIEPVVEESKMLEESGIQVSPRARRSYKRSLGEATPVRSSPRLTKPTTKIETPDESDTQSENTPEEPSEQNSPFQADVPSPRQSPRLLQKVKGRKSLSRKVLENNAFSKIRSQSTTVEESHITQTETENISEVITLDSPKTPKSKISLSVSSSVSISEKRVSESTCLDSDTSIESNIFLDSPELPERLKLSDSLVEYVKSLRDADDEPGEVPTVEAEKESTVDEDKSKEIKVIEVYEDLSSGAEDIKEVFMASGSKVYAELSNYSDNLYNELEKNIFDIPESGEQSFNVTDTSPNSDSYCVSEAEKAFIYEPTVLETETPIPQDEVIEINSSSDNDDTTPSESVKSESDTDELNISYERNIHLDEDSRYLVELQSTRTTNERELEGEEREREEEAYSEAPREELNRNELDINEDYRVEWMNSEKQSGDEQSELFLPEEDKAEEIPCEGGQEGIELEPVVAVESVNDVVIETNEPAMDVEEIFEYQSDDDMVVVTEEVYTSPMGNEENTATEECPEDERLLFGIEVNEPDPVQEIKHNVGGCGDKPERKPKPKQKKGISTFQRNERRHLEARRTNDGINAATTEAEDNAAFIKFFAGIRKRGDMAWAMLNEESQERVDIESRSRATNTTLSVSVEQQIQVNRSTNTPLEKETPAPEGRSLYHPKYGAMKLTAEEREATVATPSRRRRNSALSHEREVSSWDIMDEDHQLTMRQTPRGKAYVSDILDNSDLIASGKFDEGGTPGRRTRRSLSVILTPTEPLKPTRSHNVNKQDDRDQASTSAEPPRVPRRTRSASVDEITEPKPRIKKRSLRSNSVDESPKEAKPKGKGKASSTSQLPVIAEEKKSKAGASSVEAYVTTRRMTRRQASLVKGMETPSNVTVQDDSDVEEVLDVDAIDPIKLLDKEQFQGKPDPDEQKVYEQSSPSSSTSSFNKPAKRTNRSASMTSDSSFPPSTSQRSTPRKYRRTTRPLKYISPSGVRTRSRKLSETSSVTSDKTEPPTPPKKVKKEGSESGSVVSVASSTRSTRKRANSTSSAKSDKSTSPNVTTRSRRLVSTKSDLPEIVEEKASEAGESTDKRTKRQAKKKSGH